MSPKCRPGCIAADDVVPQVSWPRYAVRRAGLLATHGLAVLFGLLSLFLTERATTRLRKVWAWSVITVAGIKVDVEGGTPRSGPLLVVANHVSFFDPLALQSRFPPMVAISTQDIARNPIIGRMFRNAGTIFVDETAFGGIRTMVRGATEALRAGEVVLAYPEGSIRCKPPGGPFPPAVMQSAITAGAPVQPVLIRCVLRDGTPTAQASWYSHDENVVTMFRRVLRIRGLVIQIRSFPVIDAISVGDRRELAVIAKRPLDNAAGSMPRTCVNLGEARNGETRDGEPREGSGHRAVAQ